MLKTLFQLLKLMIIYMYYMCGRYLSFYVLYKTKDFYFFSAFLLMLYNVALLLIDFFFRYILCPAMYRKLSKGGSQNNNARCSTTRGNVTQCISDFHFPESVSFSSSILFLLLILSRSSEADEMIRLINGLHEYQYLK